MDDLLEHHSIAKSREIHVVDPRRTNDSRPWSEIQNATEDSGFHLRRPGKRIAQPMILCPKCEFRLSPPERLIKTC